MPHEFTCPSCKSLVTVRFLKPGEQCLCRACNSLISVPDETSGTSSQILTELHTSQTRGEDPETTEKLGKIHRFKLIHLTALMANALYLVFYLIGLFLSDMTSLSYVAAALYLLFPVMNAFALFADSRLVINSFIGLNIAWMLWDLLVINVNEDVNARIGALAQLIVAGITAIALAVGKGESWLSLYFERKRLEEQKKIRTLQEEP